MKKIKNIIVLIMAVLLSSTQFAVEAKKAISDDQIKSKELQVFYSDKNVQIKPVLNAEISMDEEQSVAKLINLAIKNNPRVHKEIFNLGATKTFINQEKGRYSPEIAIGSGVFRDKTNFQYENHALYPRSFSDFMYGRISLSQLVYDFGKTSLKIKIANDLYDSSKIQLDSVINNLIFEVRDKYYYLLFANLQKNSLEELSKEFEDQQKLIKAHYGAHSGQVDYRSAGIGNLADQSNLNFNLAKRSQMLNDAEKEVLSTQAKLANLIGMPYLPSLKLEQAQEEVIQITPEILVSIANNSKPELQYAQKQILIAQKNEKAVIKDLMPSINMFGSYGLGGATYEHDKYNNYNNFQIGAFVQTPWVNPVITKNKMLEAKLIKNKELANAVEVVNNTYLEIQEAYIEYNTQIKNVEKTRKTMEEVKKVLEVFKKMYANGEDCYIHVGEFAFIYTESQIEYYKSLYALNSAKVAIDKAVGKVVTKDDIAVL